MCLIVFPHTLQGRKVFEKLKQLESKGVNLQIAVNAPQTSTQDTEELAATGTASPYNRDLTVLSLSCAVHKLKQYKTTSSVC